MSAWSRGLSLLKTYGHFHPETSSESPTFFSKDWEERPEQVDKKKIDQSGYSVKYICAYQQLNCSGFLPPPLEHISEFLVNSQILA